MQLRPINMPAVLASTTLLAYQKTNAVLARRDLAHNTWQGVKVRDFGVAQDERTRSAVIGVSLSPVVCFPSDGVTVHQENVVDAGQMRLMSDKAAEEITDICIWQAAAGISAMSADAKNGNLYMFRRQSDQSGLISPIGDMGHYIELEIGQSGKGSQLSDLRMISVLSVLAGSALMQNVMENCRYYDLPEDFLNMSDRTVTEEAFGVSSFNIFESGEDTVFAGLELFMVQIDRLRKVISVPYQPRTGEPRHLGRFFSGLEDSFMRLGFPARFGSVTPEEMGDLFGITGRNIFSFNRFIKVMLDEQAADVRPLQADEEKTEGPKVRKSEGPNVRKTE